jgi:putative DNA primase/helicase
MSERDPDALLSTAMNYLDWDFYLLPIWGIDKNGACQCGQSCTRAGKHPLGCLVRHGLSDATDDGVLVRRWFQAYPEANLAVRTGLISGIVVVDIDPRHGGSIELARDEFGLPVDTFTVKTGGDGWHLYYQIRDRRVIRGHKLHPGIEVKGEGGYVLLPPSRHKSGKLYEL